MRRRSPRLRSGTMTLNRTGAGIKISRQRSYSAELYPQRIEAFLRIIPHCSAKSSSPKAPKVGASRVMDGPG